MSSYRPTTLSLAEKHCPKAVSFYEQGAVYDRSIFTAGIAAHHCLQRVGELTNEAGETLEFDLVETATRKLCESLIASGRIFEGEQEPPLNPRRVWEGRQLALDYLFWSPIEPGGEIEVALEGVLGRWSVARVRHVFDRLEEEETETGGERLIATDYKSSWTADADELESLQSRVAMLLAWQNRSEYATTLVRRIVNIRTGAVYEKECWPDDEPDLLRGYEEQIVGTIRALEAARDAKGNLPASPGAGCVGCPYWRVCEDGQDYASRAHIIAEHGDAKQMATAYAAVVAAVGHLRDNLKPLVKDEPIVLDDGTTVGYLRQEYRALREDSLEDLCAFWGNLDDRALGLVKALEPTVGNAEKLGKVLFQTKKERDDWLDDLTVTKARKRLGVKKGA